MKGCSIVEFFYDFVFIKDHAEKKLKYHDRVYHIVMDTDGRQAVLNIYEYDGDTLINTHTEKSDLVEVLIDNLQFDQLFDGVSLSDADSDAEYIEN